MRWATTNHVIGILKKSREIDLEVHDCEGNVLESTSWVGEVGHEVVDILSDD